MTTPINVGQPSLALPQSIVVRGIYPDFQNNPFGFGSSASLGFIFSTAFDPSRVQTLAAANAATISIGSNPALFSLLGASYGGDGRSSFALPNLQGAAPQYVINGFYSPQWGEVVGTPSNSVTLSPWQLPASLGGASASIDNEQYGVGMQYLIQTDGLYPSGSAPTLSTIGMIYPYAVMARGGVPDGFLPADGRSLSINDFSTLYSVIGNTYGGNFSDGTFALPDLRNRVPVGVGVTSTGETIGLGQEFGMASTQLLQDQVTGEVPIQTTQPSLGLRYIVNTQGAYWNYDEYTPMLGQVSLFAGVRLPDGWVEAQGQLLSIGSNQALYSLLGATFGGDGTSTFALPDLQGRTIVGTGGVNNLQIGDVQGSFSEFITAANLPEIVTPVPGVHLVDDSGHVLGDKVTGEFEIDISGVWPQARVEYSTDGTTWSETYTPQEGSNTLYVRQVNVLGQASAASQAITFVLDTTAPQAPQVVIDGLALAAPMFNATVPSAPADDEAVPRTSTAKLSFGNVEDGARLEFSTDGGQTWTDSFEAEPGYNGVLVRQVDLAGNASAASDLIRFYWDGSDTDAAITSTSTHSTGGNVITIEQHGALAAGLGTASIDLLIHGHQQDLVLPNDIEYIRLMDDGLNNTVTGHDGDNVFEVVVGNWVIQGNEGRDTVVLSNLLSDYVITQESYNGELQATLYGPEGRIIVRGVERIAFADAQLVNIGDVMPAGVAYQELDHLYEEVLGRMPDLEGLTHWAEQMSQGATLEDVAQAVAESPEFKQMYGTLSDEQLVEELYEAILDRAPDAQGLSHWVEAMEVHELTEGELIVNLLLSAESQAAANHEVWLDGLLVMTRFRSYSIDSLYDSVSTDWGLSTAQL